MDDFNHTFQSVTHNTKLTRVSPVFVLITLFFIVIIWVFFRAETLDDELSITPQLLRFSPTSTELIQAKPYLLIIISFGLLINQITRNVSLRLPGRGFLMTGTVAKITSNLMILARLNLILR